MVQLTSGYGSGKWSSSMMMFWSNLSRGFPKGQKNNTKYFRRLRREEIARLAETSPHLLDDIGVSNQRAK